MSNKQRILVLCTGNSCRSQMAEGYLNALFNGRIEAFSAGSRPSGYVHPFAVKVIAEDGIDISDGHSKSMAEFLNQPFDVVITVCDSAREACPVFPGGGEKLHHSFYDPAEAEGTEEDKLVVFRRVRDEIKAWLTGRFEA
jgi:arsenate reductase